MLSRGERAEFGERGLLALPAAVQPAAVAAMRDRFWEFLSSEHGIARDRPETWTVERPRQLQALKRSGAFDAMATGTVRDALDDLLGAGEWQEPKSWGLPLVTFPAPEAGWRVPSAGWHVDSFGPDHELPGVTVFTFLEPVAARGGGTVVLPGSHRWFNRVIATTGAWHSAEVKARLAADHPWLRRLWAAGPAADCDAETAADCDAETAADCDADAAAADLDADAVAGEVHLRVRELTGAPGDVVLMHPRTLHATAPNALATPRMMLVEIINRRRAG